MSNVSVKLIEFSDFDIFSGHLVSALPKASMEEISRLVTKNFKTVIYIPKNYTSSLVKDKGVFPFHGAFSPRHFIEEYDEVELDELMYRPDDLIIDKDSLLFDVISNVVPELDSFSAYTHSPDMHTEEETKRRLFDCKRFQLSVLRALELITGHVPDVAVVVYNNTTKEWEILSYTPKAKRALKESTAFYLDAFVLLFNANKS